MSAGLVLRPTQSLGILHVGRNGVQDGPTSPHHGLVHQGVSNPGIGEEPPVAVSGRDIAFKPQLGSRWSHPEQGLARPDVVGTLLSLGTVYADQANLGSIKAVERVPIYHLANDTVGLLRNQAAR